MVADAVELTFRRAAEHWIADDDRLLVAVSGGGDSVALLHLLHRYYRGRSKALAVGHLDHGLRDDSADDRRFVERMAFDLGLECVAERRAVGELRRRDESPEEAARRVRRGFLQEAARETRSDLIATAHTLDDQAETIVMRLARGGGPAALAGMAWRGPGPFVRPLLGLERAELRSFLERHGVPFLEDPTNTDLRFDRNRTRRRVLPVLAEALNPRAARHVVEAAERLREDSALLDGMALEVYRRLRETEPDGSTRLPVAALRGTPGPLARRIVLQALRDAGCDVRRVGARHVESVLRLVEGGSNRSVDLPDGRTARRAREFVVLALSRPR